MTTTTLRTTTAKSGWPRPRDFATALLAMLRRAEDRRWQRIALEHALSNPHTAWDIGLPPAARTDPFDRILGLSRW